MARDGLEHGQACRVYTTVLENLRFRLHHLAAPLDVDKPQPVQDLSHFSRRALRLVKNSEDGFARDAQRVEVAA